MKVTITYFKESGKYYTEDEDVEWPEDADHYTRWAPFERIVRIRDMYAVCMDSPLGFPQFYFPEQVEYCHPRRLIQESRVIPCAAARSGFDRCRVCAARFGLTGGP